jgi:hypothetical protein
MFGGVQLKGGTKMASFSNAYILTTKGKNIIAKVNAGMMPLKITKIAVGDGQVRSIDEYIERDTLLNPLQYLSVDNVVADAGLCTVTATLTSAGVNTGFLARELGVYAYDLDASTECLILAATDTNPSYISGKGEGAETTNTFHIYLEVSSTAQVEITLPTTVVEITSMVSNLAVKAEDSAKAAADSASTATAAAMRTAADASNAATALEDMKSIRQSIQASASGVVINPEYANSAGKLFHARTISLAGDMQGSAAFDGTMDIAITATLNKKYLSYMYQIGTDYEVGDIAYVTSAPSYVHLECISGGRTDNIEKIAPAYIPGDVIQDGSVKWQVVDDRVEARINQRKIIDIIYPVGSIYLSINSISPASLFGGTWTALKDYFLIGASENRAAGETGGEETHTLTVEEMPEHRHAGTAISTGRHHHGVLGTNQHPGGDPYIQGAMASGGDVYYDRTTMEGEHSHTLNIENAGEGTAHNNMPPYLAVYMWKRTA